VPVRDFEAGVPGTQRIAAAVDEGPLYVVVFAADDDRMARLRAVSGLRNCRSSTVSQDGPAATVGCPSGCPSRRPGR
jgi:hypothetical protein